MSASAALYLASASPRRRELLALLDYPFTVLSVDVEEQRRPEERPQDYVQRLARDKSQAEKNRRGRFFRDCRELRYAAG